MDPSTLTIDARLLCASVSAYGISGTSTAPVFTQSQPYYDAVGFVSTPDIFVSGIDNIDACLVGTMSNVNGGNAVVLAFRGTLPPSLHDLQSMIDWMNDFYAAPTTVANIPGQVHSGFWDAITDLWPGLLASVKAQMNQGGTTLPLYITGHSKGGGLASLAAMNFAKNESINPTAVYTYASPHAGDTTFAAAYNAIFNDTRYEYADDIVPHLPPNGTVMQLLGSIPYIGPIIQKLGWSAWDYSAVGTLKFINWSGEIVGDSFGLELERMASLTKLLIELNFSQIAADHSATCGSGYMSAIAPTGVCPTATNDAVATLLASHGIKVQLPSSSPSITPTSHN